VKIKLQSLVIAAAVIFGLGIGNSIAYGEDGEGGQIPLCPTNATYPEGAHFMSSLCSTGCGGIFTNECCQTTYYWIAGPYGIPIFGSVTKCNLILDCKSLPNGNSECSL
jgi:hypothetical protein